MCASVLWKLIMNSLQYADVHHFIVRKMAEFYESKLTLIQSVQFEDILQNFTFHWFHNENMSSGQDFVVKLLELTLRPQEDFLFEALLKQVAIFVTSKMYHGYQSSLTGIDLEFQKQETHYFAKIRLNNQQLSFSKASLKADFEHAKETLLAQNQNLAIQPIIGTCYGNSKTILTKNGVLKLYGQSFWHFLSGDVDFYIRMMKSIGQGAKKHAYVLGNHKEYLINRLIFQFIKQFCLPHGTIDWEKLLQLNSQNLDMPN